jgi:hypothetical protein
MPDHPEHLIVEGITEDGQRFRPSDWIERLIEAVEVYGNDRRARRSLHPGPDRRQRQLLFLQAQMLDDNPCLMVDLRLRDANPAGFAWLMEFVRSNRLRTRPAPGD